MRWIIVFRPPPDTAVSAHQGDEMQVDSTNGVEADLRDELDSGGGGMNVDQPAIVKHVEDTVEQGLQDSHIDL